MDWDKNGTISCIEFKSYLAKLKKGEDLDHAECVEAFNAIDVDGSKQINWNEFFVSSIFLIGANTVLLLLVYGKFEGSLNETNIMIHSVEVCQLPT